MGDWLPAISFVSGIAIYALLAVNAYTKRYFCLGFAAICFSFGAFFNFILGDAAWTAFFVRIGAVSLLIGVVKLPRNFNRNTKARG